MKLQYKPTILTSKISNVGDKLKNNDQVKINLKKEIKSKKENKDDYTNILRNGLVRADDNDVKEFVPFNKNSEENVDIKSGTVPLKYEIIEEESLFYDMDIDDEKNYGSKIKKYQLTNFSSSLSSRVIFNNDFNKRKNSQTSNFFRSNNTKKNAISLRKDNRFNYINNINQENASISISIKYPRRPTTTDYGTIFKSLNKDPKTVEPNKKEEEKETCSTSTFNSNIFSKNNINNFCQRENKTIDNFTSKYFTDSIDDSFSINKKREDQIISYPVCTRKKDSDKIVNNRRISNKNIAKTNFLIENASLFPTPNRMVLTHKNYCNKKNIPRELMILGNNSFSKGNNTNMSINQEWKRLNTLNGNTIFPSVNWTRLNTPMRLPKNNYNSDYINFKKQQTCRNFYSNNASSNNCSNNTNLKMRNMSPCSSQLIKSRPKSFNGVTNFKIDIKHNQEPYKSVLELVEMTTKNFLPFSKKRDKSTEIQKLSIKIHDKVEKELKEAKKREDKAIKIKSKAELSEYLLRDYFIGEKSNPIYSSKKRLKLTKDFDKEQEIEKKKKMAKLKNEIFEELEREDLSDSQVINKGDNTNNLKDQSPNLKINDEQRNLIEYNKNDNHLFMNQNMEKLNKISQRHSNIFKNKDFIQNNIISEEDLDNFESNIYTEINSDRSRTKEAIDKDKGINSLSNISIRKTNEENENNKIPEIELTAKYQNVKYQEKSNKDFINGDKKNAPHPKYATSKNKSNNLVKNNDKSIISLKRNELKNGVEEKTAISKISNEFSQLSKEINDNRRESYDKDYFSHNSKKLELKNFLNKLPLEKLQHIISSNKKKMEEKIRKEISMKSKLKADQILDISLNDYHEIEPRSGERINQKNVNLENLTRVIRVRNILKGKHKKNENKRNFKKINKEEEDEINKIIRFQKLGPPSFLKTNFKKETNLKFKMLGGKFFGCKV